jgi:diguanylate cyclase (GGDEF)-like protein
VDRVYFFQFSADGKTMNNTHEWCAAGVKEEIANMQNVPVDNFPWWAEQIRSNECVYIPDVDAMPEEARAEREEFQAQKIQTILCVPITHESKVTGLFGFDSVHSKRRWEENEISLFRIAANTVSNALQKFRLEQELIKISISDQLTGLYNRRHLYDCMAPLLEEYRRNQRPFAILFFDIDYFKRFNDTYGHSAGDFVLQRFAVMLKDNIRPFDVACRYGGEEFVVLAKGVSSAMAQTIAGRILDQARQSQFEFEGQRLSFTLSCGIAVIDELSAEALSVDGVIDMADRRLYLAKQSGRDRCVWADISPCPPPPK